METCSSANTGPEVQSMFLVKPLVPRLEDVAKDPQLILATVKPQVPLLDSMETRSSANLVQRCSQSHWRSDQ